MKQENKFRMQTIKISNIAEKNSNTVKKLTMKLTSWKEQSETLEMKHFII